MITFRIYLLTYWKVWNPKAFFVHSLWVATMVQEDYTRKLYFLRSELWPECEERWDRIEGFFNGDKETISWATQVPKESLNDW